jgi:hypothetical protein
MTSPSGEVSSLGTGVGDKVNIFDSIPKRRVETEICLIAS